MALCERQKEILEFVEKKQRVSVEEIAKKTFVSPMTVRRDLEKMQREGYLKRYHGGAVANGDYMDYPINTRMHINEKQKKEIALAAEKHINDNGTVFLTGSSTCSYLIPHLKKHEGLLVVTNSVQFMIMLSRYGVRCILTGGEHYEKQKILLGRHTENFIRTMNFDIMIFSCDGISDDGSVTVENESGAELVKIGFANSKKRVLLADGSKLGLKYTYNVCRRADVDDVIIV